MYVRQLFRIFKAKNKRSQHNIAMRDKCWRRQAFRQHVSHHFVCVQWNKFKNSCFDHLTDKVSSDINVPRKLSAHCVFAHSHTCQIVFKDFICGRLLVSKSRSVSCRYVTLWAVWLSATKEASDVDRETLSCRSPFYDMGPPFIIKL